MLQTLLQKSTPKTRRWGAIALGVAAIVAAPFALPSKARVERSIEVAAPAASVYALVNSASGFNQFNPFRADDPTLQTLVEGPQSGPGSVLRWSGQQGEGSQTIVAVEANRRVEMRLDLGPQGEPTQVFSLQPTANGTRVTWALEADFGANPVGRLIGLGMDGMLGPKYEAGLLSLKSIVENSN